MQMQLLKAVKNMSDGFSLVLAKNDLNAISNQYLSLKKEYVGIDPGIFESNV